MSELEMVRVWSRKSRISEVYDQIVEQPVAAVPAAALQSDVIEDPDFIGCENR